MPFQMCSRATGWFFSILLAHDGDNTCLRNALTNTYKNKSKSDRGRMADFFFFNRITRIKKKNGSLVCPILKKSSVPNTLICQHETAVWCYYAKRHRLKETGLLPYFRDCNDSLAKNIWIYPLQSRWKKKKKKPVPANSAIAIGRNNCNQKQYR